MYRTVLRKLTPSRVNCEAATPARRGDGAVDHRERPKLQEGHERIPGAIAPDHAEAVHEEQKQALQPKRLVNQSDDLMT